MPADDLGLRRCIARYYCQGKMIAGREIVGREARRIAQAWPPFTS